MAIQWLESNQMQVNPSKFQFMAMYSGLNPGPIELTIGNQVIQSVECVKLLGIHIGNKLSFDKHILTLCQRVFQQCNALNRMAKFLSKESKECLFNAFILSNFMCGNLVWHHFYNKCHENWIYEEKSLENCCEWLYAVICWSLEYNKRCLLYVSRMKSTANEFSYIPQLSHIYWKPCCHIRYSVWLTWRQIYDSPVCWDDRMRFEII